MAKIFEQTGTPDRSAPLIEAMVGAAYAELDGLEAGMKKTRKLDHEKAHGLLLDLEQIQELAGGAN